MDAARAGLVDRYIAALRALGRIDTAQREREWRQFAAHLPMHQLRRQVLGIEVQAYGAQRHRHEQRGANEENQRSDGMSFEKHFDAHITKGASTAPTTDELATINAMAIAPLAADDVYVVRSYLAHNGIDRDREAFDPSLLNDFANSLPGKGLFVSHPGEYGGSKGPGVGRFFAAKVLQVTKTKARQMLGQPNLQWPPDVPEDGALLLDTAAYMANTAGNADLITNLRFGVASDVSIGFRASSRSDIQDATGNVIGQRLHGPGEAYEGSLVWLGAQPGARTHKAAGPGNASSDASEVERLKAENAELRHTLGLAYAAYERESKHANKLRMQIMAHDDSEKDFANPFENTLLFGSDDAPPQGAAPAASKGAEFDSIGWLAKKERERREEIPRKYEQNKQAWQGDEKDLTNPLNNPLLLGSDD